MSNFNLLLVDDDEIDRMMIRRSFMAIEDANPPEIYEARDGDEALRIMGETS